MIKAKLLAQKLLETVKFHEPKITKDIMQIASLSEVEIVGLENRFKSEESLAQKLTDYAELRKTTLESIAKDNNDTLRFTYLLDEEHYFDTSEKIKARFRNRNYKVGKIFNAWSLAGHIQDTGYRGINITIISSQKQKFELQLHTKASLELKNETHSLYKESRNPNTSRQRRFEITKIMVALAIKVIKPKGL